ncbi:MAG: DUF2339 domain-containing protein [Lentisphaerae bacterium]|nr:DUF2339 domain-containing protein [Lentisphaerota bacterium]
MEIALTLFLLTLIVCCFLLIRKLKELQQSIARIEEMLIVYKISADTPENIPEPEEKIPEALVVPELDTASALPVNTQNEINAAPGAWKKFINWLLVSGEYYSDNVSREYTAATAWLIRAGVLILICAVGFMLKYSFDHNLFSPALRIASMALAGSLIAAVGFIFTKENKYRQLFLAICGTGFAVILLSIFAGFRICELLPFSVAATAVLVVIALCVGAAWNKSSQFLASVGAVGVYIAPWLIFWEHAYGKILLYFAIAGCGLSILSAAKKWLLLRILIVAGYSIYAFGCAKGAMPPALLLVLLCFFNLLVTGIPYFIRREMVKVDYMLWVISTGVFLLLALGFAHDFDLLVEYKVPSIIVLVVAILNGVLFKLNSRQKGCPVFAVLAIASLVLSSGLLGMDLWLTAMWSILALALAVAACRVNARYLAVTSVLLFLVTAFSLPDTDCFQNCYSQRLLHNIFSYGIYPVTVLIAAVLFKKNEEKLKLEPLPCFMVAFGMLFLFGYLTYEMYSAFSKFMPGFKLFGISVGWSVIAAILIEIGINARKPFLRKTGAILFALSCLKVLLFDLAESNTLWRIAGFCAVGVLLIGAAVIYIRKRDIFRIVNPEETDSEE